jgi:acetylornithine deacetylase
MLDPTLPLDLLKSLVEIPSVNPMGGEPGRSSVGEAQLTDFLESLVRRIGLPSFRQPVAPGRANLWVRLDGSQTPSRKGPVILFDAHQDTVPCVGMTIPPWTAEVRDGKLFGRGACDVKGPMAAMLAALARLKKTATAERPTVILVCTVDEECGFSGARALVDGLSASKQTADGLGEFVPQRPTAAIVAEPTDLSIVVAHKGIVRWPCHTRGRAAHSAQPEKGDNAIYGMGRVLGAIDHYQREVVGRLTSHRLCGPGSVNVGTISGGNSVNTVPASCAIEIDRRLSPSEEAMAARQHLIDAIERETQMGTRVEHGPLTLFCPPLSDEHNGDLADRLARSASQSLGHPVNRVGVAYATEAAWLAQAGIPSVVFGPGAIEQAHTADEWISIAELERGARAYYDFIANGPWPIAD